MSDLTEKSNNKQTDSGVVTTTKNQYQILEIQSIEDENEKQNLIEMGIKCVTPGLPKEKLDDETKQQVKNVVDDQNGLIRERNKRTLKNIEEIVNDDDDDEEEEGDGDDENDYDGEDDKDNQHSSGEESKQNEVNKENESESKDSPNSNKKGSKFYNIKSIHRMHAPSPLNLKRQPSIFNKRIKTATDQTPQSSSKSKIMIKYTGYNQNLQTTPQQMTPEFSQQMALYQQQQLAMYQQQMNLQRSQQQQFMQANPQLYQHFYMNYMMMNPLNGTPIAYNQNMLQQFQGQQPFMNTKKEATSVQKRKEKNSLSKNKEQPEREKEDEKENEKEEEEEGIENNEKEAEEEELEEDGKDQPALNKTPESATENLHYEGMIRINYDNFQFEFETLIAQTVGKLPIQINELNKKKFLKICEKIWDESYWLMKKREQYSNPTPTGLNPVLDIQQRDEGEDEENGEEKVIANNESEISSQKEESSKDQE
ncbi:hypothetical protein HANVADRAFT_51861 [Hanseniaspora valbyensis NRRL Y-1626]|uniref:Uncharacterized protein n=1 Tax=Hanseniaspora valbyensis NRRL Y-1626 TaxID=766949 RepID=A0A1B7THB9_9ASCO|nr:hypothetical protein HANVADRAFT_51861 [Hanseniaspora valbyensis NRRL Y-1626]